MYCGWGYSDDGGGVGEGGPSDRVVWPFLSLSVCVYMIVSGGYSDVLSLSVCVCVYDCICVCVYDCIW